jgi:type IV pilus assembly protein PilP
MFEISATSLFKLMKYSFVIWMLVLTGCQTQKQDLSTYVSEVRARQKPDIEPLPVMKPYQKYTYSASELRNPFIPTVVESPLEVEVSPNINNGIKPDENRQKEALEEYMLSELQFVGTLGRDSIWGLIRTSDGVIHRVQVGHYMGSNHGQIQAITESDVTLKEIVPDGKGAYVEQESTISIAEVN